MPPFFGHARRAPRRPGGYRTPIRHPTKTVERIGRHRRVMRYHLPDVSIIPENPPSVYSNFRQIDMQVFVHLE